MQEDAKNRIEAEHLLDLGEVASILRASRTQVWRYRVAAERSERLITIKIGGSVRVHPVDLADFINRHRT